MKFTIPQKILLESDEDRRRAERQAYLSGSIEDKAKALLQRVRHGEISHRNLQLAAGLGDENSRQVLETLGLDPIQVIVDPKYGGRGLDHYAGGIDFFKVLQESTLSREEMVNFGADCITYHYREQTTAVEAARKRDVQKMNELLKLPPFSELVDNGMYIDNEDVSYLDKAVYYLMSASFSHDRHVIESDIAQVIHHVLYDRDRPPLNVQRVVDRLIQYLKNEVR